MPRGTLRLTKLALVVVVLGFGTGHSLTLWPLMTWGMYSTDVRPYPSSGYSRIALKATSSAGQVHEVAITDVYPFGRTSEAEDVVEETFGIGDPVHRAARRGYLTRLVGDLLPGVDVATIQGWRREWDADPLAVPPLDPDRPDREILLGSFAVGEPTASGGHGAS